MSASLDTICPIPDDLLPPDATDPQARVEWRTPGTLKVGDIPPRDYPEQIDEDAAGAMEAERDALQARVTELERVNANLLRDVAYLNGKLDEARAELEPVREKASYFELVDSGFVKSLEYSEDGWEMEWWDDNADESTLRHRDLKRLLHEWGTFAREEQTYEQMLAALAQAENAAGEAKP